MHRRASSAAAETSLRDLIQREVSTYKGSLSVENIWLANECPGTIITFGESCDSDRLEDGGTREVICNHHNDCYLHFTWHAGTHRKQYSDVTTLDTMTRDNRAREADALENEWAEDFYIDAQMEAVDPTLRTSFGPLAVNVRSSPPRSSRSSLATG